MYPGWTKTFLNWSEPVTFLFSFTNNPEKMTGKRKRGHGWSSVVKKKKQVSKEPVSRNVKVRFVCPSLQKKQFKVRSKREYSPGLHTVLHYPQRVQPCHQPYTLKPKRTKIKSKYEFSKGLHTVLHYPQEIVLKHFVHVEKKRDDCVINYKIVREMNTTYYLWV